MVELQANQSMYKKEIEKVDIHKATLVRVIMDNDIYRHTKYDYGDIRLKSRFEEEGYFIRQFSPNSIKEQMTLQPSSYDRKSAALTYQFEKPFDVEKIVLDIQDRNFESIVDVYMDGNKVIQQQKIFDYSNETGNRNFTIVVPKSKVSKIKIVYDLNKTIFFYKKYQKIIELSKYLSIKRATFFSKKNTQIPLSKSQVSIESQVTKDKKSIYFFKTDHIPFSMIEIVPLEKNFKRNGHLYTSDDGVNWRDVKGFSISSSNIGGEVVKLVKSNQRSRYIKLEINDGDNKPLNINEIILFTVPNYLYFIANPDKKYTLFFGESDAIKPKYELSSIVNDDMKFIEGKLKKLDILNVDKVEITTSLIEEYKELLFMFAVILSLGIMIYIAFGLLKK